MLRRGCATASAGASAAAVSPAIQYRGTPLRARKQFFEGTPRGASPAETLDRLRPCWDLIGLTRLANITGLDRIGIPVTLAIRPNSPDIGTNCGKGLTLQTALASAGMEALEHHCGETFSGEVFVDSYETLRKHRRTIPIERLAIAKNSLFHPAAPERWCIGWDLVGDAEVAVPYEQVKVSWPSRLRAAHLSCFQTGTNGLASGNSLAEATVSALLELVERDAIACHLGAQDATGRPLPIVRLDSIEYPVVRDLLARLHSAEVETYVFDLTTDLLVPTFHAAIFSREGTSFLPGTGWGAALDAETALVRALTEAAQTRLVQIYGARDDLFRRKHEAVLLQDCNRFRLACDENDRLVDVDDLASMRFPTFEQDIEAIIHRLGAVGLEQVIVFDLTPEGVADLAGVRVIVPGLEGYRYETYRPGERARAHSSAVA
jgi:ribosomal protein S12 methylthiotransferase accessory factor